MNVGRVVRGFCEGYFGRDHYHDARIEAEGHDWIVVRALDGGTVELATFQDADEQAACVERWAREPEG